MLVGISGYAQSGKDTVAGMLKSYGFERMAFADPIRDALYVLNPEIPTSDGQYYHSRLSHLVDTEGWDVVKVKYPEARRLLQILGTQVAREQWYDDFWIKLAFGKMKAEHNIITDVRFPNECVAIRQRGGTLIKVLRPGVGPVNAHISDNALSSWDDEFDFVINNDGTKQDLLEDVRKLVTIWKDLGDYVSSAG